MMQGKKSGKLIKELDSMEIRFVKTNVYRGIGREIKKIF